MGFNTEDKITWVELAPSLQDIINKKAEKLYVDKQDGVLQKQIDDLTKQVSNLKLLIGNAVPIGFISLQHKIFDGWIIGNGTLYNRVAYAELWKFAQESGALVDENTWYNGKDLTNGIVSFKGCYSTGDGYTTFRVPDLRACFFRSVDLGKGTDPNRNIGTEQLPTLVAGYDDNNSEGDIGFLPNTQYGSPGSWSGDRVDMVNYLGNINAVLWQHGNRTTYNASTQYSWYNAVRPRNIAVYPIIRAKAV